MVKFRADPSKHKVDLGVGVFRDAQGHTPVLRSVRHAEAQVLAAQDSKSYVGPAGRPEYNTLVSELVLGADHPALRANRVCTLQTPGGCGALRVGAELLRLASPSTRVHVSEPTWSNHIPLLSGSGLALQRYRYYDTQAARVDFDAMLAQLQAVPAGEVVLLQASCHNPTGADLSDAQWDEVLRVLQGSGALPFVDLAYQGFGESLEADAYGARLLARELPEVLIAVSHSKNFGLYRERVGALVTVSETPRVADAIRSQLIQTARGIYSMPPDHGAAIVAHVLADPAQRTAWIEELSQMATRIRDMRALLADELRSRTRSSAFDFIGVQHGMFSLLGASAAQVAQLRERDHVYMTTDSRMNLAGVTPSNVHHLADAIVQTMGAGKG